MRQRQRRIALATGAAAFIGATGIGLLITDTVVASGTEEPSKLKIDTSTEDPALSDFPTNASGLTYGSDAEVNDVEKGPDLVAVIGDSGVAGYVTSSDLNGPDFSTPEEALEWQREHPGDIVIDVFDVTGENIIDTFTLEAPEVDQR